MGPRDSDNGQAPRQRPYTWGTRPPKLLPGECACEWTSWFETQNEGWVWNRMDDEPQPAGSTDDFWPQAAIYGGKYMEPLTLILHKTKDTKNKVVYGTKDGSVIQSVYIDKDALGDAPPNQLQVVISSQ